MTAKELLLHVTKLAYDADEMALLSDVFPWRWEPSQGGLVRDPDRDLTDEAAKTKPERWHQPIWGILKHVGECKATNLEQAFGPSPEPYPEIGESLESLLAYVEAAQRRCIACIEALDEAALDQPVPTDCHGESAAHLFWVLAQHDVAHGAQTGVLRAAVERRPSPAGETREAER